jgi:LysR family transcriptional activator of mexEF-oprN operon
MSEFDLNQIRRLDGGLLLVFRELLRTRRASTLAERLGLSPSAISHALTRLRDVFGDQLFVRRPHGFEPTRRVIELGPKIEALIDLAAETMGRPLGFDPASSRRVFTFGAPEFVMALIGADLINRFRTVAPRVAFSVTHVAEEDAFKALRQGGIDFAIGRFGAARPGFTVEPLYADPYCIVVRQGHPRVEGAIDFEGWRDIGHVFAGSASETASDKTGGIEVAWVAAAPHWLTVLMLVASTDAIATVPRRLAERHAQKLGLQVLDPPFEPNVVTVSVTRRAGVEDAGADWLLERIREALAA